MNVGERIRCRVRFCHPSRPEDFRKVMRRRIIFDERSPPFGWHHPAPCGRQSGGIRSPCRSILAKRPDIFPSVHRLICGSTLTPESRATRLCACDLQIVDPGRLATGRGPLVERCRLCRRAARRDCPVPEGKEPACPLPLRPAGTRIADGARDRAGVKVRHKQTSTAIGAGRIAAAGKIEHRRI